MLLRSSLFPIIFYSFTAILCVSAQNSIRKSCNSIIEENKACGGQDLSDKTSADDLRAYYDCFCNSTAILANGQDCTDNLDLTDKAAQSVFITLARIDDICKGLYDQFEDNGDEGTPTTTMFDPTWTHPPAGAKHCSDLQFSMVFCGANTLEDLTSTSVVSCMCNGEDSNSGMSSLARECFNYQQIKGDTDFTGILTQGYCNYSFVTATSTDPGWFVDATPGPSVVQTEGGAVATTQAGTASRIDIAFGCLCFGFMAALVVML
ncbi:hypothetical protein TWF694_011113 [Orbilia ellipsospora]|uniref:Uncharacterized protein n=1 Tax=Orbilia ellipsospora TaxID=2528407 RepID=A0AAV9X906_9PEZI